MIEWLFVAHQGHIVSTWIASASDDYFDQLFSEPTALILRNTATAVYSTLNGQSVNTDNPDDPTLQALASFAELQAVRDCDPIQAAGCIYLFKPLLRELILPEAQAAGLLNAYLEAESRLDSLALLFFAAYTRCRERLHAARLDALRREQFMVRRWAERHGLETES